MRPAPLPRPRPPQPGARRRLPTTPLAAALLLAGCASMAPPLATPALPVPAAYAVYDASNDASKSTASDTADAPGGLAAATLDWRTQFADPALRALIDQALANNRDLRLAALQVAQAQAAWGIQQADRLPSLGAQAEVERSRTPAELNLTRKPISVNVWQVGVAMPSWEIDFWGRVRSLDDAALARFLASDAARRASTVAVVSQVAQQWLVLRELDQRIALAQQTLASRAETLRITRRRVDVGASGRLALTQVETLLQQAQALGAQLQLARAQQAHALALLVGAPVDLPPPVAGPASPGSPADGDDADPLGGELRAGLPSELLVQRPDIVAAEQQLRAANADIGAARAAFFPRVALTGALGTASTELDGLWRGSSAAWSFTPSISLPLLDGQRRRNALTVAELKRDAALASYDKAVQTAFRDVADALSARRWLAQQLAIAQAALATQTERARLAQRRFDAGSAAFLEVLDAQRDLLAAQQQQVQARRALLANRVALFAALGGGTLGTAPPGVAAAAAAAAVAKTTQP